MLTRVMIVPSQRTAAPRAILCAICVQFGWSQLHSVDPVDEKACPTLRPWSEVRTTWGRKKTISTQGYARNRRECVYYHHIDERIHALVG
jgi:hypothetical protein